MAQHRLLQLSDPHLSAKRAYAQVGWEACLRYVEQNRPDFVAVTGDHVLDDPDDDEDQHFAYAQLSRIVVPWQAVPGNHDIGDCSPQPYMGQALTQSRRSRWLLLYGPDWWTRELGQWRLVGLNAILPGSGFPEEGEQLSWLVSLIADDPKRPLGIFLHKPLYFQAGDDDLQTDYLVAQAARSRLRKVLRRANLRFVASGHAHAFRTFILDDVLQVWAPSTGLLGSMPTIPVVVSLAPGLVSYVLDDTGSVDFCYCQPDGLLPCDLLPVKRLHGAMRFAPPYPPPAAALSAQNDVPEAPCFQL